MKSTNLCWNIEKIENYELAKADNFKNWVIHHRLETHDSSGNLRKVELTSNELIALDMYFYRPENELIFLTKSEHRALHNSVEKKGKPSYNKGKKMPNDFGEKISKAKKGKALKNTSKMNKANIGKHWYTNGQTNVRAFECPDGFKLGRTYKRR